VWAELERAAPILHVTLERLDVTPTTARLDEVFAAMQARRPDAVFTLNDPFFFVHRERILATATELRHRGHCMPPSASLTVERCPRD
jgi:hypothetical protein